MPTPVSITPVPMIELRGVSTVFGPQPAAALARLRAGADKAALLAQGHTLALQDISLTVAVGELFVVVGLSGSGKSTLVRHINRLVEPTEGQVLVAGQDMLALPPAELRAWRRERLAMVFQGFGLLPHRSVLDNVALPLQLRGLPLAARRAQARDWVQRVALAGYEQHLPEQLSGGMQQRVGLARALCAGTDTILMDEPFSALDPLIRAQLQDELLRLQASLGRTIVFITHDLDEALRLGDRIAVLHEGRLLQVGTPTELLAAPADAQVARFVAGVNRARALTLGQAMAPWPPGVALPPAAEALAADTTLEQALPLLLGRHAPLTVQRAGVVLGQVSLPRVQQLLAASSSARISGQGAQ